MLSDAVIAPEGELSLPSSLVENTRNSKLVSVARYCHRVITQLQLTNIIIIIINSTEYLCSQEGTVYTFYHHALTDVQRMY
jgi:hypothetical protein